MVRSGKSRRDDVGGAPVARRMAPAGLGDVRLWLGIALLVVSTLAGMRLLSADEDTVTVWRARHDLSAGAVGLLAEVDLEPVAMPTALAGGRYAPADADPVGMLRWPIAAGELVPVAALTGVESRPTREVTVPVDPLHAPAAVGPGDRVDVWATRRDAAGVATADPTLVLAGAQVAALSSDAVGVSGELGVALAVPVDRVAEVVAAARGAVIDLVAVPLSSQEVVTAAGPSAGES